MALLIFYLFVVGAIASIFRLFLGEDHLSSIKSQLINAWIFTQQPHNADYSKHVLAKCRRWLWRIRSAFLTIFFLISIAMILETTLEILIEPDNLLTTQNDFLVESIAGIFNLQNESSFSHLTYCTQTPTDFLRMRNPVWQQRLQAAINMRSELRNFSSEKIRASYIISTTIVAIGIYYIAKITLYASMFLTIKALFLVEQFSIRSVFLFPTTIMIAFSWPVAVSFFAANILSIFYEPQFFSHGYMSLDNQPFLNLVIVTFNTNAAPLAIFHSGAAAGIYVGAINDALENQTWLLIKLIPHLDIIGNIFHYFTDFMLEYTVDFLRAAGKTLSGDYSTPYNIAFFYWVTALNLIFIVIYVLCVLFVQICSRSEIAKSMLGKVIQRMNDAPDGPFGPVETVVSFFKKLISIFI